MKKVDHIFFRMSNFLDWISQLLLFCLMCFFIIYIVLRFFGITIYGTVEIAQFGCLFIVVFGLARNDYKGGNIIITVFRDALPPAGKKAVDAFSLLFTTATCVVCELSMIKYVMNKYSSGALSSVLKLPIWAMSILICIGFLLLAMSVVLRLLQVLCDYTNIAKMADQKTGSETQC